MAPDEITPDQDDQAGGQAGSYEYVEEIVEYRDTRWLRILLSVVLVILFLLLAGVGYLLWTGSRGGGTPGGQGRGGGMVWIRSIYGWGTGRNEQLSAPNAVAVGPDGVIWSNSSNRQAVAFNADGSFDRILMSSPTSATSQLATAAAPGHMAPQAKGKPTKSVMAIFSIDVDGNNNLYIGDDAQGNVIKFTNEGKLEQGWSVPGLVKAAANDNSVAIIGKAALGAFTQNTGTPIFQFGTRGQGKNQFDFPVGVHIDDKGFVYVADTQNRRVRKFTPSGRLVWDAGTPPDRKQFQSHVKDSTGLFQLPTGVTTDANGHVVVIDAFNYNITLLDSATGKKVAAYGEYGQEDGQFDNPSAITYDAARDYFVVADTNNNRVQVVRLPNTAPLTPSNVFNRAFENPIWILCLPLIILLIAAIVTLLMNRRRKRQAAAVAAAGASAAGVPPGAA